MDVIIVSKTHMSNSACVGAVTGNGSFVRLLDEDGYNQDVNTSFNIGDVWTVDYQEHPNKTAPHIEDILITNKKFRGTLKSEFKMLQVIQEIGVKIWRGRPDVLFDGKLNWTNNGSGYINEENGICANSVGFWISDRDLTKKIFYEKTRYSYPNINGWRSLPYVGYGNEVDIIPAGTLMRVSLARWWDTNGTTEKRCSLQLSGWYDLTEPKQKIEENDDLPF